MAKKNKKITSQPVLAAKPKEQPITGSAFLKAFPAWLSNFRVQALIVAILAFACYINTVQNENALDDYIVIIKNEYVQNGFAGLPDIFTKDAFDSYWKQFNTGNQLSGGRYRPLSIATFAIEQQIFGGARNAAADSLMQRANPVAYQERQQKMFLQIMHVRHFFNVLWYTLSVVVLLYFLRYVVFRDNPLMALLAAIIFTIHPIHTEVVANVKSRDEIMSLLFIGLTFICAFKYREHNEKKGYLFFGLLCYFLAFLSKEYAIGLIILLPLSFVLFHRDSLSKSIMASLPYMAVTLLYVIIRLQIISQPVGSDANMDILNDPYALASATQKVATLIATPLNYLRLLIFPHPLSADYSYNSIPYKDFGSLLVWLSLAVHAGLVVAFFYFLKRKNVLAFAIAFYLINLLLICNFIFNIGGTMGERLIYHSSLGFSIAVASLLIKGIEQVKPIEMGKLMLAGCVAMIVVLCGFKTINRNTDWKNDRTLFTHDLAVVPNSFLVNANLAADLVSRSDQEKTEQAKTADLHQAIKLLDKTIQLNKNNATSYFNKSVAWNKMKEPDSVVATLNTLYALYPNYPQLADMYFNAGGLFFARQQYALAGAAWQTALKIRPGYALAQNALNDLARMGQPSK